MISLVKFYSHEISDTTNLRSLFCTNAAYQGLKHLPDFAHRYLTEEVPYGLVVIRGTWSASGHANYRQSSVVGSGENGKRVPCGVQVTEKRCNIYASTSEIWTNYIRRHIGTSLVY